MTRRLIALGLGVAVLVIILLSFRACLDARKERGFDNYISDLTSAVEGSNQLSSRFFSRLLEPPSNPSEINLEAQIAADRSAAEGQVQQVEAVDVPDELANAQAELLQAFELRRDGLAGIAADIPTALGDEGRFEAVKQIAADMRAFLASDVLYDRARADILEVLSEQEVDGTVPPSPFLPEPVDRWLDDLQLAAVFGSFAPETGANGDAVRGLALLSTSIDKTDLTADAENTVSLGNALPDLKIEVQNQGEVEETEVIVSYVLSGGPVPIEGQGPPLEIDAQGIEIATLAIEQEPELNTPYTLEIEVLSVPNESVFDNNRAIYTVSFE